MKALVTMAAVAAAGVVSSMAQTVYSVNVVGFVNLDLVSGNNMIGNPLNGTNNNINTVIPSATDGTTLSMWDPVGQKYSSTIETYYAGFGWDPGTSVLDPGKGLFVVSPGAQRLTFVGEVPQGTLTQTVYPGGNLLAHMTPQQLNMTDASYPANDGDTLSRWNTTLQKFDPTIYTFYAGYGWDPGDLGGPLINVGEAVFIIHAGSASSWTRTFTVN